MGWIGTVAISIFVIIVDSLAVFNLSNILCIPAPKFAATGEIHIGQEVMTYTGKNATQFTGLTRGAKGSIAAAHADGAAVVYAAFTGLTRGECTTTATAHSHLYAVLSNSFTGAARGQDGTTAAAHNRCAGISNFAKPTDFIERLFAHEAGHICGLEDEDLADKNIMSEFSYRGSYKENGYWHVFVGVKNALVGQFRLRP